MARIWDLISKDSQKGLMRWQHEHHPGVKLEPPDEDKPLVTFVGKIEDLEEIDKIMRKPPASPRSNP